MGATEKQSCSSAFLGSLNILNPVTMIGDARKTRVLMVEQNNQHL